MSGIDWSKAPQGTTHFHPGNGRHSPHWYKQGYFCVTDFESGGWVRDIAPHMDTSEYVPRPTALVGTTYEVHEGPCDRFEQREWLGRKVKVIHFFKNRLGQELAAVEAESGECNCFIVECLRPVEQSEPNERENGIQALIDFAGSLEPGVYSFKPFWAAAYDAGLRAPVQP